MKTLRIFLVNVGMRQTLSPLATPPLGIMYLAAYLRTRFNCEIKLLNQKLFNNPNAEIARMAAEFDADIVGLGAITPTAQGLGEISRLVRAALPKALVVLGGPHVNSFGARSLENNAAHVAVPGEGEVALEHVINTFLEGESFSTIPGIFWRDEDGQVISNPGSPPKVGALDDLPFPAYDLIDLQPYFKAQSMPPIPRRRYISLFSSRGCPYKCNYCHDVFGKRFRQHSAQRVADEVEYFTKKYGVDDVEFVDDIFNLNPKRLLDFCDIVHQRGLKFKIAFPNGVRTDILDEDHVEALVSAGMYFASFALESGSPRIQQVMGKQLNIERFLRGVKYATDRRVYANGFAMMGFPTETAADMQMTIDVACESTLHTASFFTVTPFPGTELYKAALERKPEELAKLQFNDLILSELYINFSDEPDHVLFAYQREANRKFFANPHRMFRVLRDYPKPHMLPVYLPILLSRMTKGLFTPAPPRCFPEEQPVTALPR
jgi:anaerobic magnesium-protoporphyrin IX monomethyl ester cyclase